MRDKEIQADGHGKHGPATSDMWAEAKVGTLISTFGFGRLRDLAPLPLPCHCHHQIPLSKGLFNPMQTLGSQNTGRTARSPYQDGPLLVGLPGAFANHSAPL